MAEGKAMLKEHILIDILTEPVDTLSNCSKLVNTSARVLGSMRQNRLAHSNGVVLANAGGWP